MVVKQNEIFAEQVYYYHADDIDFQINLYIFQHLFSSYGISLCKFCVIQSSCESVMSDKIISFSQKKMDWVYVYRKSVSNIYKGFKTYYSQIDSPISAFPISFVNDLKKYGCFVASDALFAILSIFVIGLTRYILTKTFFQVMFWLS